MADNPYLLVVPEHVKQDVTVFLNWLDSQIWENWGGFNWNGFNLAECPLCSALIHKDVTSVRKHTMWHATFYFNNIEKRD